MPNENKYQLFKENFQEKVYGKRRTRRGSITKFKNMFFQNDHWIIQTSRKQSHHNQDDCQYSGRIGT